MWVRSGQWLSPLLLPRLHVRRLGPDEAAEPLRWSHAVAPAATPAADLCSSAAGAGTVQAARLGSQRCVGGDPGASSTKGSGSGGGRGSDESSAALVERSSRSAPQESRRSAVLAATGGVTTGGAAGGVARMASPLLARPLPPPDRSASNSGGTGGAASASSAGNIVLGVSLAGCKVSSFVFISRLGDHLLPARSILP